MRGSFSELNVVTRTKRFINTSMSSKPEGAKPYVTEPESSGLKRKLADQDADEDTMAPMEDKSTKFIEMDEEMCDGSNDQRQPEPVPADGNGTGMESVPGARVMNNELIVDLISKKLPLQLIRELRSTCQMWNNTLVPGMTGMTDMHHPILLCAVPTTECKNHSCKSMDSWTRSLDEVSPNISSTFTKFRIFHLGDGPLSHFNDFMAKCGKSMRSLSLDHKFNKWDGSGPSSAWLLNGLNTTAIRRVVFQLAPELTELKFRFNGSCASRSTMADREFAASLVKDIPKLRRLALEVHGARHRMLQEYPDLLVDILSHSPGLQFLEIANMSDNENVIAEVITMIREFFPCLEKIKMIKLNKVDVPALQLLIELAQRDQRALRLEKFAVVVICNQETSFEILELLHSFLGTQSDNLKELEIEFRAFGPIRIPRMKQLQTFNLDTAVQCSSGPHLSIAKDIEYDEGSLQDTLPSLRRCSYYFPTDSLRRDRQLHEVPEEDEPLMRHDGVTQLSLNLHFGPATSYTFPTWIRLLPSVTHLDLQLHGSSTHMLGRVWNMWPRLAVLRIRCDIGIGEIDQQISGIPRSKFVAVLRELREFKDQQRKQKTQTLEAIAVLRRILDTYKTKPGISDMRELQEFSLEITNDRGDAYSITDIGGYLGFAMASSKMQRVSIESRGKLGVVGVRQSRSKNEISAECREFIRSVFGVSVLINV